MKKLLVLATSIALALPAVSNADGPPRPYRGDHGPAAWHDGDREDCDRDGRYGDRGDRYYGREYRSRYAYPQYYPAPRYYPQGRYYGRTPAPYYYGGNRGGRGSHDHDDAMWAIGGLIVGAVIGTAIEQSKSRSRAPAAAPSGPPPGCRDRVVYDSDGTPRVQRDCQD